MFGVFLGLGFRASTSTHLGNSTYKASKQRTSLVPYVPFGDLGFRALNPRPLRKEVGLGAESLHIRMDAGVFDPSPWDLG